jgi:hypothetical protein
MKTVNAASANAAKHTITTSGREDIPEVPSAVESASAVENGTADRVPDW